MEIQKVKRMNEEKKGGSGEKISGQSENQDLCSPEPVNQRKI